MPQPYNAARQTNAPLSQHRSSLHCLFVVLAVAVSQLGCVSQAEESAAPVLQSEFPDEQIATAKKHEDYAKLYAAQLVAVGTVAKRDGPVAEFPGNTESHPEWVLFPTELLYRNKQFAQEYTEYTLNGGVPDADLELKPYLYAQGFADRQVYLGPASEEILQVATIAAEQRSHDEAVLLHQAKTNPSSHPLFKAIRDGKNVATVDVVDSMARSISIDRAGNVEQLGKVAEGDRHVVLLAANLRGKFPQDGFSFSYLRISRPLPKPAESQPLIVVWEMDEGKARATHVATMQEATLRIAAAALQQEFGEFSIVASGPQHGSSRGSDGPGENHHDTGLGQADSHIEEEGVGDEGSFVDEDQ